MYAWNIERRYECKSPAEFCKTTVALCGSRLVDSMEVLHNSTRLMQPLIWITPYIVTLYVNRMHLNSTASRHVRRRPGGNLIINKPPVRFASRQLPAVFSWPAGAKRHYVLPHRRGADRCPHAQRTARASRKADRCCATLAVTVVVLAGTWEQKLLLVIEYILRVLRLMKNQLKQTFRFWT